MDAETTRRMLMLREQIVRHKDYPRLPHFARYLIGGTGDLFQVDIVLMEAIYERLLKGRKSEEVLPEPLILSRDEQNPDEWYITCFQQSENQERRK